MDIADERFVAVYTNPEYNIEPSSHEFKHTNNMESLIDEKIKRKTNDEAVNTKEVNGAKERELEETTKTEEVTTRPQESIDNLIKSVKSKTNLKFKSKKKQNK